MRTNAELTAGYAKFKKDMRKVPRDTTCKTIAVSGDTISEEYYAVRSFSAEDLLVPESAVAVCKAERTTRSKLDEVSSTKGEGPPQIGNPPLIKVVI